MQKKTWLAIPLILKEWVACPFSSLRWSLIPGAGWGIASEKSKLLLSVPPSMAVVVSATRMVGVRRIWKKAKLTKLT